MLRRLAARSMSLEASSKEHVLDVACERLRVVKPRAAIPARTSAGDSDCTERQKRDLNCDRDEATPAVTVSSHC